MIRKVANVPFQPYIIEFEQEDSLKKWIKVSLGVLAVLLTILILP